jgi:NADPH-dependent curcumin reductase CurA
MPGLTAYFGLLDICRPQPGETVVVSGAAGAVGSLVGQIARIKRCRAVGIAGSQEKIRFITEDLGFDAGFNYKETKDYYTKLKELCPNGIDIYFDNVGGAITNAERPEMGPRWLGQLVVRQAKAEGFLVTQFSDRYEEGLRQLSSWLGEKRIQYREDVMEGLENAPRAFIQMMEGHNIGKQLVKVETD